MPSNKRSKKFKAEKYRNAFTFRKSGYLDRTLKLINSDEFVRTEFIRMILRDMLCGTVYTKKAKHRVTNADIHFQHFFADNFVHGCDRKPEKSKE